jgi:Flp pilus assembly protein TadG
MMAFFKRGMSDQQGAAALEFALIFPVLFILHIAAVEALGAYQAQRKVSHIAAVMADITAQNRTVTTEELDDVLKASLSMIYPYPNASLQQRVSSLSANGSGSVSTDWTVKKGYSSPDGPSVPSGYLTANESVIVTDVVYDYRPTFGLFMPETIRFTRHAYARPRLTVKVEKIT